MTSRIPILAVFFTLLASFAFAAQDERSDSLDSLEELPSFGGMLVDMLIVLGVLVLLLLLVSKVLPRWLGNRELAGRGEHLEVIDTLHLDPKRRICLVRVADELHLISVSEQGVTYLARPRADLDDPDWRTTILTRREVRGLSQGDGES